MAGGWGDGWGLCGWWVDDVRGDDKPFLLSGSSIALFAQGRNQSVVSVCVCECVGVHAPMHTLVCICCKINN